jgi:transposase
MSTRKKSSPDSIVREIKRKTRRKYSAEEKIRIVLEGLRGERGITDLCRKEGIHPGIYYKWSKAFLEAGKQRLTGDTVREAGSEEVPASESLSVLECHSRVGKTESCGGGKGIS